MTNEFLTKLKNLLAEYNASIDWNCGEYSDMHGVYDERMDVYIGNKVVYSTEGGSLSKDNILS